jgi:hypothetical protein
MAVELCYWKRLREEERETEPEKGEKGRAAREEIRRRGRRPGAGTSLQGSFSASTRKQEVAHGAGQGRPRSSSL